MRAMKAFKIKGWKSARGHFAKASYWKELTGWKRNHDHPGWTLRGWERLKGHK